MSEKTSAPAVKAVQGHKDAPKDDDDNVDMRETDERLARIHRTILPETPYIMTVPSDRPYNLHPSQRHDWQRNTPFDMDEEHLQYQSFFYREPGDDLIVLRTQRELQQGYGRERSLKTLPNGIGSGTSTPLHAQGGKKKISLSAYKNKRQGEVNTPTAAERTDVQGGAVGRPEERSSGAANGVLKNSNATANGGGSSAQPDRMKGVLNTKSEKEVPRILETPPEQPVKVDAAAPDLSTSAQKVSGPAKHESSEPLKGPTTQGQKRPLDSASETRTSNSPLRRSPEPALKKPRLSPPEEHAHGPPSVTKTALSPNKLPPLLPPPSNPPTSSGPREFPPLVSLKLGSPLEREIATAKQATARKTVPASTSKQDLSVDPMTPSKAQKKTSLSPRERYLNGERGFARPKSRRTSPSPHAKEKRVTDLTLKPASKVGEETRETSRHPLKSNGREGAKHPPYTIGDKCRSPAAVKGEAKRVDGNSKPQQLLVKLKYGKTNVTAIKRLLQMPTANARSKLSMDSKRETESDRKLDHEVADVNKVKRIDKQNDRNEKKGKEEPASIGNLFKAGARSSPLATTPAMATNRPSPPKSSEKRPRAEDDRQREPPAKRPKTSDTLEVGRKTPSPSTPAIQSPFSSQPPSAQKHGSVSHKNNLKVEALKKTNSSQGTVSTPQGAMVNGNTPAAGSDQPSGASLNAALEPNKPIPHEIKALQESFDKYMALGRTLKHEHTELASRYDANELDEAEVKRCAVLGVEVILCFTLAFALKDHLEHALHRPDRAATGWRSTLELLEFIRHRCRRVPHLEGLCAQLEALIFARILLLEPAPLAAERAANPREFKVSVGVAEQHTFAREGERRLPMSVVMSVYPRTWQRRSLDPVMEGEGELRPGEMGGGGFFLPLHSVLATPVQGVRMGLSLLGEFAEREGVGFEMRVVL